MNARNAFINSGSFLDSSTSLIKAFTDFHLYFVFAFIIINMQILYLKFTNKKGVDYEKTD